MHTLLRFQTPWLILELQGKTKTSYVPSNASKPTKIKNKQNKSQTKMIADYPQKSPEGI